MREDTERFCVRRRDTLALQKLTELILRKYCRLRFVCLAGELNSENNISDYGLLFFFQRKCAVSILIQKPLVPTPGRIVYVYSVDFNADITRSPCKGH